MNSVSAISQIHAYSQVAEQRGISYNRKKLTIGSTTKPSYVVLVPATNALKNSIHWEGAILWGSDTFTFDIKVGANTQTPILTLRIKTKNIPVTHIEKCILGLLPESVQKIRKKAIKAKSGGRNIGYPLLVALKASSKKSDKKTTTKNKTKKKTTPKNRPAKKRKR